uniref:Uncharacterized protein n=1 Tax=Arundo donax TaxID=35708 RepID=A0A0A9GJJ6_ARUDO
MLGMRADLSPLAVLYVASEGNRWSCRSISLPCVHKQGGPLLKMVGCCICFYRM